MRKMKRIMCSILSLCLAASTWMVAMNTFSDTTTASAASDYGLVDNVQDGQILQCWNWSFNNIKNKMAKIAEQGFSAIQTSPIQGSKESTTEYYSTMKNSWWVYYQPINFNIEKNSYNALGTASEFKAMCTEAEKYGIKVIVDAVLNHTANNNAGNTVSTLVPSDLRNDSSCWHNISVNSWYETRWDITQFCMEGIPDLNTGSSKVQNYAIGFLKECIDAGADGFRFDGAKHIEVPTDFDYASNFWPNVIGTATSYAESTKGFTPYYYGEILDSTAGSSDKVNAQDALNSYMNYMSVTQSSVSNSIRKAVAGGNAKTAARSDFYFDDGTQSKDTKSVLWNESHDTYISGSSSGVSTTNMNKTWALVGSRENAAGLYMARPSDPSSTMLGAADSTGWTNTSVQAVNQFKNDFVGESEYLSDYSNFAMIERGTTGAVIVNTTGTSASVNINAYALDDGSYYDAITGNTFTVANGKISGSMGSTGIAVVRKAEAVAAYSRTVGTLSKLNKSSVSLVSGKTTTAKATITGGTVTWKSNKKSVATVKVISTSSTSSKVRITAKKAGTATITCTHSDGTKKTVKVTVTKAGLALNKTSASIVSGKTTTAKATFTAGKVTWSTSDIKIANVEVKSSDSTYCTATISGKKAGTATITCTHLDGTKKTIKVTVTKASLAVNKTSSSIVSGKTTTAKTTFKSGSVSWTSSDPTIATFKVNSTSSTASTITISGKKAGTATITCTHLDGTKKTIKVTVKEAGLTLNKSKRTITVGNSKTATATFEAGTVTWKSSNKSVATVKVTSTSSTSSKVKITGKKAGTATVTCTHLDGTKKTIKVTVS